GAAEGLVFGGVEHAVAGAPSGQGVLVGADAFDGDVQVGQPEDFASELVPRRLPFVHDVVGAVGVGREEEEDRSSDIADVGGRAVLVADDTPRSPLGADAEHRFDEVVVAGGEPVKAAGADDEVACPGASVVFAFELRLRVYALGVYRILLARSAG